MEQDRSIAVIGLGYVGLPLALGFAEAGVRGHGRRQPARRGLPSSTRGHSPIEDITDARLRRRARARASGRSRPIPRSIRRRRRRLRLRPDAGHGHQGPRPRAGPLGRRARPRRPPRRAPRRPPVDHLPGHHDRPVPGGPRARHRPAVPGADFDLAFAPERVNPGDPASSGQAGPAPRRRLHPGGDGAGGRAAAEHQRHGRRALLARRRRDGEAPRERLPEHQHRVREPARPPVRADGPRRLGGHRRRRHQAVRVHEVHPRARRRRALHPGRSRTTSPGGPARSTSPTASSSWPPT